jgi:hypothetical protein
VAYNHLQSNMRKMEKKKNPPIESMSPNLTKFGLNMATKRSHPKR